MRSERPVQAKRRCHLVSRMACRLVCLMGVAALVCAGAEGPADEMEAVWIAQDGPIPTNMTHAAWRAEKLARRAERLKPVVAMSKTWVYCRHYVLGRRSTFLHLSELSDAFEQRSYRAIGSSLCLAEYQPDGLWKETTLLSSKAGCYGGTLATYEGMRRCVPFIAPTIATRIQSGGARIEVGLDAWAELPGVLAGKVTWAPGSALLIDTRNDPVRISGHDLLGASVIEKTGANDLVLTSSPVGVSEIRVREGNLRTSEPDLIPPAVKVLSLGGQYLNNVASTSK